MDNQYHVRLFEFIAHKTQGYFFFLIQQNIFTREREQSSEYCTYQIDQ